MRIDQSHPSLALSQKPDSTEYPPYAEMYMKNVPSGVCVLDVLRQSGEKTLSLLSGLSDEQASTPCAPGKWTVKDVVLHLSDDERIYSYRALRFARGDATELPGFDQNHFASLGNANVRRMADLLREFELVRHSTLALFASFDESALMRTGVGDGKRYSVRALAYHVAGHELHHIASLQDRYLNSRPRP